MPDNIHYQDDKGDLDVPTRELPDEGGIPSQPPEEPDDKARLGKHYQKGDVRCDISFSLS